MKLGLRVRGSGPVLAMCSDFNLWLYYYLAIVGFVFGMCDFDVGQWQNNFTWNF